MPKWKQMKISLIGSVATNLKTSKRNLVLADKFPDIVKAGIGRHPWGAHKFSEAEKKDFELLIKKEKVSIIGEIGLDRYFVKEKEKQVKQNEVFEFFINLAELNNKPIMIHLTGAEDLVISYLETRKYKVPICCHWYSGVESTLKKLIDLGCYFSINPAITRSKAHKKVIDHISIDRILTESDGPVKYNEEISGPQLMHDVIVYITKEFKLSTEELAMKVKENFKNYLFL